MYLSSLELVPAKRHPAAHRRTGIRLGLPICGPPNPTGSEAEDQLRSCPFAPAALPGLATQLSVGAGAQPLVQTQGEGLPGTQLRDWLLSTSFQNSAVPTPSPHPASRSWERLILGGSRRRMPGTGGALITGTRRNTSPSPRDGSVRAASQTSSHHGWLSTHPAHPNFMNTQDHQHPKFFF